MKQGMYDKTLFVVTADHGMSFKPGEFGRRQATNGNVDQVLWVPLFIKAPGQDEGQVNERNWEHVDLVPTVADMLGIKVPWEMDGFPRPGPRSRGPAPRNGSSPNPASARCSRARRTRPRRWPASPTR